MPSSSRRVSSAASPEPRPCSYEHTSSIPALRQGAWIVYSGMHKLDRPRWLGDIKALVVPDLTFTCFEPSAYIIGQCELSKWTRAFAFSLLFRSNLQPPASSTITSMDAPHRAMRPIFEVRATTGKGNGAIATHLIQRGARIIKEAALVAVPPNTNDTYYLFEALSALIRRSTMHTAASTTTPGRLMSMTTR